MAGIGFDLLRLVKHRTYRGLLGAYGLTALMSSGPGLFIILGLGVVCFFRLFLIPSDEISRQFLSIIIYLYSASMILSSLLQYTFFRFIADIIYVNKFNDISSNFIGILFIQFILSCCVAIPAVFYFFAAYSLLLKLFLVSIFIVLTLIWITTVLLTGIKSYHDILWAFGLSYVSMVIIQLLTQINTLEFLLFEFLVAQIILFILLLHAILSFYPTDSLIRFDFLKRESLFYSLIISNFCMTLGFWVDKFIFWFDKDTSIAIFDPIRISPLYDFPMFIAYLSIIPAMTVFLFQIESNFSMVYPQFMKTIFRRKTLSEITAVRNELTLSGRNAVVSIFKAQYAMIVILFLLVTYLFTVFNVIPIYLNILFILIIGTSLNLILWAIINVLYYMTRYIPVVYVAGVFLVSNILFTILSLYAGPYFYGYGFCLSLLLSISIALYFLNKSFSELEYYTFMMTD